MGLCLSNQDEYIGADDRQAEIQQDDGSFRANVSKKNKKKTMTFFSCLHSAAKDLATVMQIRESASLL